MTNFELGLLFHLWGDYITQNHWLAVNKTKSHLAAFIHATIYSLPFLFICGIIGFLIIWISHFFIDRYRLAIWVIRFKNGSFVNGRFQLAPADNCGFDANTPVWLSTWLMIIVDNIMHITINSISIQL